MFKNAKFSRTIAKMQVSLCLLVCVFANSACQFKDLYLRVDDISVTIAVYDVRLDLLWGVGWKTEWLYSWDETVADFGPLGYTKPDYVKGTIYNVNPETLKRFSSFNKIFNSDGGRVSLTTGATYDMLFYNFGTEWTSFNQSDDYESYIATTRKSSQSSWIRTQAESQSSDKPAGSKSYIDYNQPDELFGTLVTGLTISDDPQYYEKEVDEDGNITYIYKIDANLRPYSFIYVFQIILLNNYDEEGIRVTGGRGITVTGLSQGVDLFTRKTLSSTVSLTTDDVKPLQHKKNVTLENGQVADSADVFAVRMLTWGLPDCDILELSTKASKAAMIDDNYIGIGLALRNGATYTITRNITDILHNEKPSGGIVTIYIDSAQIPNSAFQKQNPSGGGGGFNASVEDWADEVNAEVII